MERGKLKLVIFCFLTIGFLAYPLSGYGQRKPAETDFPSNENLAQRNVALLMEGFAFGSGLRLNEQGKPNLNGIEIIRSGSHGSGFIVGEDGTIVTNYHVAGKSLRGQAKFQDGSTYEIRNIKVYNLANDIAILKISGQRAFPKVELGDSDRAEPRDKVIAVGNPRGRGINITEGTVSQVVRDDYNKTILITHTATITFGNSGGALYKGSRVIGINTSGGEGFNHAVPINKAKELLENPQYRNRLIPLERAFPPNYESIRQKARQLDAMSGQVPAARENEPGAWTTSFRTYALEDFLFIVNSPGKDLALVVIGDGNRPIGMGDLRGPDFEALLLTSKYPQDVTIGVLNYDSQPANFGLQIFQIVW